MNIPLSRPDITEREIKAVVDVLNTPHLSLGPKSGEFEEKFADYIGTKYAVAVNSGTGGLHLIIRALGIGEGDEVITTPFSFIASSNCILFEQGRPLFIDIDSETLNIDCNRIEDFIKNNCSLSSNQLINQLTNQPIKAILAVDVFGQPADWDKLSEIAKKYNIKLIEDSAEALGTEYYSNVEGPAFDGIPSPRDKMQNVKYNRGKEKEGWKKCGTFGDAGVFAFYPNKQITTGEGGMVVTNNKRIADLCRSMRNQGRDNMNGWLEHKRLGYNYRISDINCALGITQLERIDEILYKRAKVAFMYNEKIKRMDEIIAPSSSLDFIRSWFVYVIRLKDIFEREERDKVIKRLKEWGIECSSYFPPIHLQPFYKKLFSYKRGDFPVTESISDRTIALPFHNNLQEREIDYVVKNLKECIYSIKNKDV